jgi:hypothetical protein
MPRPVIIVVTFFLLALTLACGSGTGTATTQPAATTAAQAAATTQPAPTAQPATEGNVGDRIEANGIALTVTKVDKADSLGQFQKAKDGDTFVVAEVVIENVSQDKAPYNPLYFKVKDGDGYEYNATISTADNSLKSGELAKGDKARGTVAVEVKKDSKDLVLAYQPIVIGSSAPIKVKLP